MAKVVGKGTVLQEEISSVYTAVAQIISIDLPEGVSETVECDTLDNANAGIPYGATGRTEGGSCSGEMFLDPALAGHKKFTAKLTAPLTTLPTNYKIIFADTGVTEWIFAVAGVTLGGTVAVNDLLKATFALKLDEIVAYPA